jgi:hypothetical protein
MEVRVHSIPFTDYDTPVYDAYFAILDRLSAAGADLRVEFHAIYPEKRAKDVDAILARWEHARATR